MKAFMDPVYNKDHALKIARLCRRTQTFFAFVHYWDGEKGNLSGCMYHEFLQSEMGETQFDCKRYAPIIHGIPMEVAGIIDDIFAGLWCNKGMDKRRAMQWAENVYTAIPVGADLSGVPDKLAAYILETPSWMAEYADERGAHLAGLMHGIFQLRIAGVNQAHRLEDFYYDHMAGLRKYQLDGRRKRQNYVMRGLKAISEVEYNQSGAWSHFLTSAVLGSAKHRKIHYGERWHDLSKIFLQILEDSA